MSQEGGGEENESMRLRGQMSQEGGVRKISQMRR